MPFSSLNDPVDVARAQAASDSAWNEVRSNIPAQLEEGERTRLDYIVAALVAVAEDKSDLAKRAIEHYRQTFAA